MGKENNPYEQFVYFSADKTVAYFDIQEAPRKTVETWLKGLGGSDSEFIIRFGINGDEVHFSSQELITDDPKEDERIISDVLDIVMCADYLTFDKIIPRPQSAIPYPEHYIDSETNSSLHRDHQTPGEEH